jgi:rubrerythrin/predicted phosphodiesterase
MSIQKIQQEINDIGTAQSFTIIGDPGCEGLGTTMMEVYAHALAISASTKFTLVVGDFVPQGTDRFYRDVTELTNIIAQNPVYALRGNHDTGEYDAHFGRHNYALIGKYFTVVVLDNALRKFEPEGLELLQKVLARPDVVNVVVAFHIPLPNHYTKNSVSQEEFAKLQAAYHDHKDKIAYFICGHVHSRFIDTVDDKTFICTGGGGAMIEDVSADIRAADVNYHVVRFTYANNQLAYKIIDLNHTMYSKENTDTIMRSKLYDTVKDELLAHLKYLMFAERAQRRGYTKVANLFRALGESEYRHARNFYAIYDRAKPFSKTIADFIPLEDFEYQRQYKMLRDHAQEKELPLTEQAYSAAAAAEKEHAALLRQAADMDTFEATTFYVCPVCGYLMTDKKDRCPVCGVPARDFEIFTPVPASPAKD